MEINDNDENEIKLNEIPLTYEEIINDDNNEK